VIVLGVVCRSVLVPENFTRIECGCPFFRLAGVAKLKP
jgi:hypothetical protein